MQEIKIFISSPGDVSPERGLAHAVIERLQGDYWNFVRLEPILWEYEATRAVAHFNEELIAPAGCDIVLAFLWTRLGSRMPPQFTRKDGSRFDSGTEWEIVTAAEAHAQTGRPDLMVYRRFDQPPLSEDPARRAEAIEQRAKLELFWREWFINEDGTIRRAFVAYEDPQQLAPRLTEQLRQLIHRRLPASVPAYDVFRPEPLPPGSPFRGLHAFSFEDAPLFFGRSRAVAGIARQFEIQAAREDGSGPFVLILGGSGSGKSSLARAGVAARLTHPNTISSVDVWRRADCHPSTGAGLSPLNALAGGLLVALPELAAQTLGDDHALDTADNLAVVLADPEWLPLLDEPFRAALEAAAQSANGRTARAFVVVDQLEELFTDKATTDEQREAFVHALAFLAGTRAVWVAATMRSEFFARAIELPALRLLMRGEGSFTLLPPDAGEISQIVRYPAAAANLAFERHPQTGESLADAIHAEATQNARALPLLEFLLQDLYEHKDKNNVLLWARYEEIGKLAGALVSHADAALHQLREGAERDALDLIFLALVTMDDQEQAVPTRNRAPRVALERIKGGTGARVLEVFIAARLFITDAEEAVPVVSLAHEALLAHWPYLQEFVKKHAGLLRARRRLADLCNRWQQKADYDEKGAVPLLLDEGSLAEAQEVVRFNPPDLTESEQVFVLRSTLKVQRRVRRLRAAVAVFAILAVLASVAGVVAWGQREIARTRESEAVAAKGRAVASKKAADELISFMQYDLRDTLGKLGNLDMMAGINARIQRYHQEHPPEAGDQAALDKAERERAITLLEQGNIRAAQGNFVAGLESNRQAQAILERLVARDPASLAKQSDLSSSQQDVGALQANLGDWAAALTSYGQSRAIAERLAASDPANLDRQGDLSTSLQLEGDIQVMQGDFIAALASYGQSRAIAERLVASDPANLDKQRRLSVNLERVGKIQEAQGDLVGALESYRTMQTTLERLAARDPAVSNRQRDLALGLARVGSVQQAQGDLAGALASYRQSQAVREKLATKDPANADWQRDLALSLQGVGGVQQAQGDLAGALESFRQAQAIRDRLAARDPTVPDKQRDLALSLQVVGGVQQAQGDLAGALESFRQAQAVAERLVAKDPANAGWQSDLSVSLNKVGDVQQAQGDLAGALESFRQAQAVAERLVAKDPAHLGWQRDLAVGLQRVGIVQQRQHDLAAALDSLRQSQMVFERLVAKNPAHLGWQRDLTIGLNWVGSTQEAQGDLVGALESYRTMQTTLERLAARDPANTQRQLDLAHSERAIGKLLLRQAQTADARGRFEHYRQIVDRLASEHPSNYQIRADRAFVRWLLVDCVDQRTPAGKQEALQLLTNAAAILGELEQAPGLQPQESDWLRFMKKNLSDLK